MKKRIAFITGATGGIGTAICQQLYDKGVKVIGGYISEKGNEKKEEDMARKWNAEQEKQGYQFEIFPGDVADYGSCSLMIKAAQEKVGQIDILVNVAGITDDSTFVKMDHDKWQHVLRVDLESVYNVTHQVVDGMIERGFGRIINISSVSARKGNFGQTNYAAAKAGISGFTKSLALELAKKGVTVNTVSPGYVDTQMFYKIPEKIQEKILTQIPLGRLAKPSEIACAVVFLASDDAAYITGSDIAINGGLYMY